MKRIDHVICIFIGACTLFFGILFPDAAFGEDTTSLYLDINGDESLEYLEDYTSLESLELNFEDADNRYTLDTLPCLPSLRELTIHASENLEISEAANGKGLVRNSENIEKLYLDKLYIGSGPVEKLENLKTLVIQDCLNCDLEYEKLNLQELDLTLQDPYSVPITISYDDYTAMRDCGTTVTFPSGAAGKEKVMRTWEWIEDKADEMDLDSIDSEQGIVDEATAFVMEELTYDPGIQSNIDQGLECDTMAFYHEGQLYAVMEKDTAICGNYSSLLKALLIRSNVDCCYVFGEEHAWNLVEADGLLGYVDVTALDGSVDPDEIRNGNGRSYGYYMDDVEEGAPVGELVLFPEYMKSLGSSYVGGPEEAVDEADETEDLFIGEEEPEHEDEESPSGFLIALPLSAAAGLLLLAIMIIGRRREENGTGTPAYEGNAVSFVSPPAQQGVLYWKRLRKKAVLRKEENVIGKARADLVIPSKAVSREHAVIRRVGSDFWIFDMNSTNGTFVNGKPVTGMGRQLISGDRIRLANEEFRFRCMPA